MSKHSVEIGVKILLIFVVIIFIFILLVKRFVYFRPSSTFLQKQEKYQIVKHGHLHGWLLENKQSDKIILLCNGNTGNMSYNQGKIISLKNLGFSVLAFDYSGYGNSGGVPTEQQLYDDASSMTALIRKTYNQEKIIIYGEFLGGSVATYVARKYSIPTLILESPVPSVKEMIKNKYPMIFFLSFLFPEFDTASYLNGYRGKSLILYSPTDEIAYDSLNVLIQLSSEKIQIDDQSYIPWDKIKEFIDLSTGNLNNDIY